MIKTGDGFPSPWTGHVVASESRPESGLLDLGLHFGIGDRAKRYPSPENSCSRKLSEFGVETSGGVLCFLLNSGREAVKIIYENATALQVVRPSAVRRRQSYSHTRGRQRNLPLRV